MINSIKVLNTVTALGADVSVGTNGLLNVAGQTVIDARSVTNVAITTSAAETAGVITITPTAAAQTYTFTINAFSKSTGLPKTMLISYTATASDTATTISNAFRAQLAADTDMSVTGSGTATFIVTSTTGYPKFTVGGSLATCDSYSSAGATTIFTNVSANNTTAGVTAIGTGSLLQTKYGYNSNQNAIGYSELSNLTTTSYYTEVVINYNDWTIGNGVFNQTVPTKQAVVLVLYGTSAQGSNAATSATTTNYNTLLGTFGTITGLQAGQMVSIAAASANASVANGVITIATDIFYGNSDTNIGLRSGDIVAIANVSYPIASILTGSTAATYGTPNDASADTTLYAKWRPLPI